MGFIRTNTDKKIEIPSKEELLKKIDEQFTHEELFCLVKEIEVNPGIKKTVWLFIKKHLPK